MNKCKITVLKKIANFDLVEAYMGQDYAARPIVPCHILSEGQTFIIDHPSEMPKGFCGSAWITIHPEILCLMNGGDFTPWVRQPGTMIVSCKDGFRPVVFKLERLEEQV